MLELLDKFPLYTDRLELRPLDTNSINWYIKEVKRPRYYKYLDNKDTARATPKQISDVLLYIINKKNFDVCRQIRLVIYDKDTVDKRLGSIVIFCSKDSNSIELAYWLSKDAEGKGIALEAMKATIQTIYGTVGNIELRLLIHKDNIKSIRLAIRCGFKEKEKRGNTLLYVM